MSNLVQPGDSYAFGGSESIPIPAATNGSSTTAGNWGAATVYNAGSSSTVAEDPTSIAIGDVNGDGKNDIVVSDDNSASGGIGVLLNSGTAGAGLFPGTATVYAANNSPTSVALGDVVPGHTKSTILDAVVANNTSFGGVSVLANGTPPTNGAGTFLAPTQDPAGAGTDSVAVGNFDSLGTSIVAANGTVNTITIIPDAASGVAPFTLSTGLDDPTAVLVVDFNGDGKEDIAVLNAGNDTVSFFLNASTGPGNFTFTAVPAISLPAGTVAITNGGVSDGAIPGGDLVVASNTTDEVWVLPNITAKGANTVSLGTAQLVGAVAGTPVGVATGMLSTSGNYTGYQDIAVAYAATGSQEGFVAVFQNHGVSPQLLFTLTGDFDTLQTNPTAIAVADLSGGTWNDIVVTNDDGRGTISIFQPIAALVSPASPGVATASVMVDLTNTNINDLVVTVGLEDLAGVNNLSLTLVAPNGLGSITLVESEYGAVGGTAITTRGLPGGTGIGVYGASTTNPGIFIGTTFDDNATRNIFDNNGAAPPANGGNTSNGSWVGDFRPEEGTLASLINGEGSRLNGEWELIVTNYSTTTPTGRIEEFQLQFTSGLTKGTPSEIATTLVRGAIGNNFPLAVPSTPNGVGPGLVLAIDNTLGLESPYQGRIYAAFVGYDDDGNPNTTTNPSSNTDIYLAYSTNGGLTWIVSASGTTPVNDDNADTDGYSGSCGR